MAKRVPPLSSKAVAAQKVGTELIDGAVPGLRCRAVASGKIWSLMMRDSKGALRRFPIGENLGLAEARQRGEATRQDVKAGSDPNEARQIVRKRAQAAREGVGTLGAAVDTYFTTGAGAGLRDGVRACRVIKLVFKDFLATPLIELTRLDLQLAADTYKTKNTASLAVRTVRPILKYLRKRELVAYPVPDLDQVTRKPRRTRLLAIAELEAVLPLIAAPGLYNDILNLLLWSACRRGEAAGMRWLELDDDIWMLPAARTKAQADRVIPLPRQAHEMLWRRRAEMGPQPNDLVFPAENGGLMNNWNREHWRLLEASGTSGWTRHDLRRTVATHMGNKLAIEPHIIKVVLGHAEIATGATSIYALSRYRVQHAEALQRWADFLDRVTSAGNVIPFERAA